MTLAVRPTTRDEDWRYADAGQLEVLEPAALDAWHDTTLAPGEVRGKDLILDDAHPGFVDRGADRFGLIGRDSANDGDQRALVEIAPQQYSCVQRQILFAISDMPARKLFSPSSSTALRPATSMAAA